MAWAIDSEKRTLEVYRANFKPKRFDATDILELLPGDLGTDPQPCELDLRSTLGKIDLLLAGPPCQGHSDLNNHTRREDPRNSLYERVGRFAELIRPAHLIVENVPTVVHGRDRALKRTVKHLEQLGYEVGSTVVELWRLGVPQLRKRHVIVASLVRLPGIADVLRRHTQVTRTVRWAIEDLKDEWRAAMDPFRSASRASSENQRRIRYLQENDRYYLPNELRPECHQNGDHSYKSMYGRLHWDEPAQTITSGFTSPGQGRFIHPSRPRTLTPHEAARLQFFPDFFDFSSVSHRTALAQMIGNAVPMKLSQVFALELLA